MKTEPNDAAYAVPETADYCGQEGLTKRELFAAMVLSGRASTSDQATIRLNAKIAVELADALIEALNKEKP